MGLDQYLYAKRHTFDSGDFEKKDTLREMFGHKLNEQIKELLPKEVIGISTRRSSIGVSVEVAYWRKSNQVHKYFVDNCQNGEDDCRIGYVAREKLEELMKLCEKVIADPSLADELLPVQEGFFFGSTDYDQYYFEDLAYTVEQLKKILLLDDVWSFEYASSW